MPEEKKIQVMIACHKKSTLPDNPLYLPVQVGAALKSMRLAGTQPDNEGENISAKNPSYCELTAQYWGWKNLDADYIGLCHYRRLFYFGDEKMKEDLRNQIQGEVMTPYTLKKYGLNDAAAMRRAVESADVVVGNAEDVSILATPYGPQPTAMKHWTAHDRALIMTDHLNAMLAILKQKYPEKWPQFERRLNSKAFVGYNCFIMKKEIFHRLCEFEFPVLEELETKVDLTNCHTQISRIYGFMGEILFNLFIDDLEQNHLAAVKHVPLVYFNDTDVPVRIQPAADAEPIAFIMDAPQGFLLMPALVSFLQHMNPERKFDLTILHESMSKYDQQKVRDLCSPHENITLHFLDFQTSVYGEMKEKTKRLVRFEPFLPWIFPDVDRLTVFSWYLLFDGDFDALFDLKQTMPVLACLDVLSQGKINDIYPDYDDFCRLELNLADPYAYFDPSVMKLDLKELRKMDPQAIYDTICSTTKKLSRWDALNMVWQGQSEPMDLAFDYQLVSSDSEEYAMPFAPKHLYDDWQAAAKKAVILQYAPDDPWFPMGSRLDDVYWKYAHESTVYETLLAHMMARRSEPREQDPWVKRMAEKLFPKSSRQRAYLTQMFPKRSRRRELLKKMLRMQ